MKKYSFLLIIFLLTVSLVACGTKSEDDNKENDQSADDQTESDDILEDNNEDLATDKNEVEQYVREAKDAYSELATLDERYAELSGVFEAKEMDDHEFAAFLHDEIIPANSKIVMKTEVIDSPNEQTGEIQDVLLSAIDKQQVTFSEVLATLESDDSSSISSADDVLNNVKLTEEKFVEKMKQLLIDYDLE